MGSLSSPPGSRFRAPLHTCVDKGRGQELTHHMKPPCLRFRRETPLWPSPGRKHGNLLIARRPLRASGRRTSSRHLRKKWHEDSKKGRKKAWHRLHSYLPWCSSHSSAFAGTDLAVFPGLDIGGCCGAFALLLAWASHRPTPGWPKRCCPGLVHQGKTSPTP